MPPKNKRHYARQLWGWRGLHGCPVCGLEYVSECEEDRREHRVRHRKILQVYEPKPMPALAALYGEHGAFVPVTRRTPQPLRLRLEGMAMMFKRELGFDFPPYRAGENDDDRKPSHHRLIATQDGRAIGGFSVRWREYTDAPTMWVLAWIWVVPSERRQGHMRRAWAMLKSKFPVIEPDPPYSYPTAKFFVSREDVSERVRAIASRRVAEGVDDEI
jgi:hypothetical protein